MSEKNAAKSAKSADTAPVEATATEAAATATAEPAYTPPVLASVADLASHVSALQNSTFTGPGVRSFTAKEGLKTDSGLRNMNPNVLAIMAGSILSVLTDQARQEGDAGKDAANALALVLDFGDNVGTISENTSRLSKYLVIMSELGMIDSASIDSMSIAERCKAVIGFLQTQPKINVPDTFKAWAKSNISAA